jgi:aspartyl-tRNA(Asn)/glutamyl-tRNA(Gln) amidotransferase subunit A
MNKGSGAKKPWIESYAKPTLRVAVPLMRPVKMQWRRSFAFCGIGKSVFSNYLTLFCRICPFLCLKHTRQNVPTNIIFALYKPSKMNPYSTITEINHQVKNRDASPADLMRNCLARIEKLNPELNAFITINPAALKEAEAATTEIAQGFYRGPLHGIPVAVKDFYDTAGMRTTAAFEHFKNRMPIKDAEVVRLLKEAGAIIIGKTNMHELGNGTTSHMSYFGSVHNPWNSAFVAGGSSGGSAAAVASGMCFASIDTDAIGSCRLPASCCGVVGFKGTYGLISGQGILAGEKADEVIVKLSHPGITTRAVSDTEIVLAAISDKTTRKAPTVPLKSSQAIRIGIVKNYSASQSIKRAFEKTLKKLQHDIQPEEIEVPFHSASLDIKNLDKDRAQISETLFKDVDFLVLPTVTGQTPSLEQVQKSGPLSVKPDNTFFCNYYSLPAITIPCDFDEHHLPIGLQIVGKPWSESLLLKLAQKIEDWLSVSPKNPGL